jgi:hypothetical protein
METISNLMKIKAIMEYYSLNQSEMAAKMGIHQANLSEILREKRACGPGIMTKLQITFPEVNTKWLYQEGDNDEPMILPNHPTFSGDITVTGNHNSHIGHGQRNISGNNNCNLPVLVEMCEDGTEVIQCPECGTVIEVAETALMPLIPQEVMQKPDVDLGQYIKKNPEKLSMINLAEFFPGATKAVEVDTRAMEPEYKKGHFIVIEKLPDLSYARADGTAYVVDAMRPHSLLRYLTRERDGSYVLTAESDKKRPIYLRADEINGVWKIVGGFWRE